LLRHSSWTACLPGHLCVSLCLQQALLLLHSVPSVLCLLHAL
jgi:hypothetical protein